MSTVSLKNLKTYFFLFSTAIFISNINQFDRCAHNNVAIKMVKVEIIDVKLYFKMVVSRLRREKMWNKHENKLNFINYGEHHFS